MAGGGDTGSAAVIAGIASAGSVGGSGVALTIGSGAPPGGTATISALAGGGGDLVDCVTASPCVYATPLSTNGSDVATTPEPALD